jgi:hypothetical protein
MATLDFTPAKLDLVLYKRDDAQFQVQFLDVQGLVIDLSGASAIAQVRNDAGVLLGTLAVTVDGTSDALIITIAREQYATWTWTTGVYDLQVTLGNGDVKTLASGTITIKGDVSYE